MAALFGLLLGKYVVYAGFLLLTRRLFGAAPTSVSAFALKWGAIRWVAGLAGAALVVVCVYALAAAGVPTTVALYVSLYGARALIWVVIAAAITGKHGSPRLWARFAALGLALNAVIDLGAHAAGLDDFKFFC